MGVEFTCVSGNRKSYTENAACYASMHRFLDKVCEATDDFTIIIPLGKGSQFAKYAEPDEQEHYEQCFDDLFGKWLKPAWYDKMYEKDKFVGVQYYHTCPLWVFIASASIFRMYGEMKSFMSYWLRLESFNLQPWTRYAMTVGLCNYNNREKDFLTERVTLGSNTNHMAMSSTKLNQRVIRHLNSLDWHRITKDLPSMQQEWKKNDRLHAMGRDNYFTTGSLPAANYDWWEDYDDDAGWWMQKAAKKAGILKGKANMYERVFSISLPDFVEQVIIPKKL